MKKTFKFSNCTETLDIKLLIPIYVTLNGGGSYRTQNGLVSNLYDEKSSFDLFSSTDWRSF